MPIQYEQEVIAALRRLAARQTRIALYRKYYAGDHPMEYGQAEFRKAVQALFRDFRYNLMPVGVDSFVDRLTLLRVQEGSTDSTRWAQLAAETRFDAFQGTVYRETLLAGVSHVLVWESPGQGSKFYLQPAHIFEMAQRRGDGQAVAGVKCWSDPDEKDRLRLTVYYKDRAERWIFGKKDVDFDALKGLDGLIAPYGLDGEPPVQRHSFGAVPAVRFCNRDEKSELADLIPIQNAINKALLDLLMAGEAYGIPQRWVVGLATERDTATGLPLNPIPKGGGVWVFEGEEIKLGQFEAANVQALSATILDNEERFARVGRIPIHMVRMGGDFPSGEALRVAESPLVKKAAGLTTIFGNSWEDLCGLAWRVPVAGLDAVWAPCESVSELERLAAAESKKRLGLPDEQIWSELGYSDQRIEEMKAAKEEQAAKAAQNALRSFSAGVISG